MEIGVKTDLKLLLECLKCQLDNPKAQKEALVTVASICADSDKGKEALLDFGGLQFIRDLVTSTKHQDVKQAAMYALACAVDANIFCQKQLSSVALFQFLHDELVNRTSVLELKKMAIYLTSCLVSNNNDCQMLVRKSGCLQVLLESFKQSSETLEKKGMFDGDHIDKTDEEFTVWSSTLLTICVSVNNPQNGENQRLCMSVIPVALKILTKSDSASVIRPISSLIGLTVSNNAPNQERLRLVGGLKCIMLRLEKLITSISQQCTADDVDSIALAIHLSGTLNSCIADNSSNKECVAELGAVKVLLTLLCCDFLDVKHRLQLIVSLVHCTDSCVESQLQLLDNGGLAVIVKYMSEIQDDEFIKAATYLLRICVQENGMPKDTINPSAKISEEKENQISANNGQLSQFGDCLTKLTLILEKMNAVNGGSHSDSDADADNGKSTKDETATVTVEKRSEEEVINADKMHRENREVHYIHQTSDPETKR
ncbi:telomere repeats-binding bouquet formation protein 1-like [Ptychodera flava]|uniref:telomere repeats-binding bouquet formation protein 1-like n=1 Tax=Ptychodera flava TaxID=63121 RepID=UPI00396A8CBD